VSILVVGHYCHDTLMRNASVHQVLGGSSAYASAILDALGEAHEVVAKVGEDFRYAHEVSRKPAVVPGRTTAFVDDYRGAVRTERVDAVAPAIEPEELRGTWDVGLACAIAGEIPLRTLQRLRQISRIVLADAQSVLREVTGGGEVVLRPPEPRATEGIDVLKASREEAKVLDVAALRRTLTLIVTDGARGCTVLRGEGERSVPAYAAEEKDPTGAGDCFLAGVAAGLARGLPIEEAARLGAWCGARAVEHLGVPRLSPREAGAWARTSPRSR
jgi:1D-myo-inositol 3-kinase